MHSEQDRMVGPVIESTFGFGLRFYFKGRYGMSMGGDFYALSDEQLTRLLEGDLAYADFLYDGPGEHPRECFSQYEHLWYELSQVLADEDACGVEQLSLIHI